MGKAKIIKHIADGKYNVQLQYGNAAMDARITTLTDNIAQYDIDIPAMQADYDAQNLDYLSIIDTLAGITDIDAALDYQADTAYPAKLALDSLKITLDGLLLQREAAQSELTLLQSEKARLEETVEAWCLEYNEELTADTMVGTVEVDYELPKIASQRNWPVVIKPDAWTASDGELQSVVAMDKWAHLYNRILSVPMMLIAPRYRVGIVTANDGEKLTVELLAAQSQERPEGYLSGHDINEGLPTVLSGLAVDYLSCGAKAFEVDDAVIVQFPPVNLYAQIRDKYLALVTDTGAKIDEANARLADAQANVAAKQGEYDALLAEQDSYIAIMNDLGETQEVRDAAAEYLIFLTPLVAAAYNAVTNAQTDVASVEIEIQNLTALQTQYQVIADTNSAKSDAFIMTPTEKTVVGFADNPRECPIFSLWADSPTANNGSPEWPFFDSDPGGTEIRLAAKIDVDTNRMLLHPSEYTVQFMDGAAVSHVAITDGVRWRQPGSGTLTIYSVESGTPVSPGAAYLELNAPTGTIPMTGKIKIFRNGKLKSETWFDAAAEVGTGGAPTPMTVTLLTGHDFGVMQTAYPGIFTMSTV